VSLRDALRRWLPPGIDQPAANAQILELAARFPLGGTVTHAGRMWRVIGHRYVGPFGPWLSIGAKAVLLLELDGERAALTFEEAQALQ
jgi:hypothetical protein